MGADGTIQSVVMALSILETIAANSEPMGITQLARIIGTTKTTIHRHVRTLVAQGYLRQDAESDRYKVGVRLYLLGQSVADSFDLVSVARPVMSKLRDQSRQAVTLSTVLPEGILIVELLRAPSAIEIGTKPGSRFEFHATAQGKLALAFGAGELWSALDRVELKRWTRHTITDIQRLHEEVERCRETGWAAAANETYVGVNALAAPIFDAQGRMVGCVALVGSVQFIREKPSKAQVTMVMSAGRDISALMGWRGSYPPTRQNSKGAKKLE